MQKIKELKSGYTTGSHAASALKAALLCLLSPDNLINSVKINLPELTQVEFKIDKVDKTDDYAKIQVTKTDNDDYDVTKGCKILCFAGYNLEKIIFSPNPTEHKPYHFEFNGVNLYIWAGKGLGCVTKTGLNPPVGYPAINSTPLRMMKEVFEEIVQDLQVKRETDINAVFEVIDGELIAFSTANPKVGVTGGISFLGKKGIVKPISSEKYIEALKSEINVASFNASKTAVFTVGNSSLKFAEVFYYLDKECFLETGNFIYDSLAIIKAFDFKKVVFIANIGKLTKIAQGKKNTNNKFGYIDFSLLRLWLKEKAFPEPITALAEEITTVGALEDFIKAEFPDYIEKFYDLITDKALETLKNWSFELNLKNMEIEVILTDGKILKSLRNVVI